MGRASLTKTPSVPTTLRTSCAARGQRQHLPSRPVAAARQLGITEVPVVILSGLTELQRRQLMLADNRIALNAGWDAQMLADELTDLSVLGADLAVLGFTKAELAKALTPASAGGLTDDDESPELSEKPVTVVGDIWLAGPHRIGCGDSTNATAVTALLGGRSPGLMVTDPPYGVNYDPEWRHRSGINRSARRGKVLNDDQADWGAAWALFHGNVAYVWHGALHSTTVAEKSYCQRLYDPCPNRLGKRSSRLGPR